MRHEAGVITPPASRLTPHASCLQPFYSKTMIQEDTPERSLFVHQKRTWRRKFRDAFRGLRQSIEQQSSYRVHICFAILVPLLGWWIGLDLVRWCVIVLCIGVVLAAEMFNTSIETLSRAVTLEQNVLIGRALDIASGAVLTISFSAAIVGFVIFFEAFLREWALFFPG